MLVRTSPEQHSNPRARNRSHDGEKLQDNLKVAAEQWVIRCEYS